MTIMFINFLRIYEVCASSLTKAHFILLENTIVSTSNLLFLDLLLMIKSPKNPAGEICAPILAVI